MDNISNVNNADLDCPHIGFLSLCSRCLIKFCLLEKYGNSLNFRNKKFLFLKHKYLLGIFEPESEPYEDNPFENISRKRDK